MKPVHERLQATSAETIGISILSNFNFNKFNNIRFK